MTIDIHFGDNLEVIQTLESASINLIYVDPPFNTGRQQNLTTLRTVRDESGDRVGFGGSSYRTEKLGSASFDDVFDDFIGFSAPQANIFAIFSR